jgi:hypothetical protein
MRLEIFTATPRPPVVLARVTEAGKAPRTEHRAPTPEDLRGHLAGRLALGVLLDKALSLDFDDTPPEKIRPLAALLKDLGLFPYYGPGTTRGSRLWLFLEEPQGDLEALAKGLLRLAEAFGFRGEAYPNGKKPVILPLYGALNGQGRPLYTWEGHPVTLPFRPACTPPEALRRAVLAGEVFQVALQKRPQSRHEAALAFLNLAGRLGVLEEAALLFRTERLWAAWGLAEDGTRTLEAWGEEVARLKEAAASPGYDKRKGVPYLKEQGYAFPPTLLERLREWPEPMPLYRQLSRPAPYPLEALGPLEGVVQATARVVQAPVEMVAATFLATAALAAQGLATLLVDGRPYPLSLYFLTIAPSGERKTEVDRVALEPVREWQKSRYMQADQDMAAWEAEVKAWEAEARKIQADRKLSYERRKELLKALGPRPPRPWTGQLLAQDTTIEALVSLLAEDWPAAGLFASEAGTFLGGYSMSKEQRLYTIATLSRLWDGREIDRLRQGNGRVLLYGRRLSVHLMSQDEPARGLMEDPLVRDQGLLARLLTAKPLPAGPRRYVAEDPMEAPEYLDFAERIASMLALTESRVATGEDGKIKGLTLPAIVLSREAKERWVAFYEHLEAQKGEFEGPVRAFAAKAAEHALRLAGVLTLFDDPEAKEVPLGHMEAGIKLAEWYLLEQDRLFEAVVVPDSLRQAEKLLKWLTGFVKEQGTREVSLREVLRGPRFARTKEHAERLLATLEEHGYLRRKEGQKSVWEVNPHAL